MSQLIIVEKDFKITETLCNLFEKRNISIVKVGKEETFNNLSNINLVGLNIDTLLCSSKFEINLGGKEKLVNFARNAKISKIIVIEEDKDINNYEIKSELGGSLKRLYLSDIFDKLSLEIIFHICCPNNLYAAGDENTFELLALSRRVASTDVTVFINGPTGSGKEVLANYLHENSPRKSEPFVAVNCAAIPENMLEAILFGHEKGAFTGASYANKGIFRAADKGTLLLDEISEMPLSLQAKLLRVLQEKKVTPVGGQRDIDVDVRVLATSNRDMVSEVKQSRFREDLYYRLNVFPLQTKNLSERKDDIIPISLKILEKHCKKDFIPVISETAKEILLNHDWPGNVRELENTLQRALVLCSSNIIDVDSIMIDKSLNKMTSDNQIETFADQLSYARSNL
ncbi:MAG: AAA family ATPase [SAR116 cluster bacterium]|nr:AAA family ATPase [SAR116 cluster bacterium]|tara:strand:+ start:505 stop:1701 length:1197 start_codon:yes stop_codon:yes gene_type:complete